MFLKSLIVPSFTLRREQGLWANTSRDRLALPFLPVQFWAGAGAQGSSLRPRALWACGDSPCLSPSLGTRRNPWAFRPEASSLRRAPGPQQRQDASGGQDAIQPGAPPCGRHQGSETTQGPDPLPLTISKSVIFRWKADVPAGTVEGLWGRYCGPQKGLERGSPRPDHV